MSPSKSKHVSQRGSRASAADYYSFTSTDELLNTFPKNEIIKTAIQNMLTLDFVIFPGNVHMQKKFKN